MSTAPVAVPVPRALPATVGRALLLLLVCALGSCSLFWGPDERELSVPRLPLEDVWYHFEQVSKNSGHPMDNARSDRGKLVFVSKWRSRPMAFGKGRRTRVHGRFVREDEAWVVFYWVERQNVPKRSRALDPVEDDWEDDGQELLVEQTIGAQLQLAYGQELRLRPQGGNPYDESRR